MTQLYKPWAERCPQCKRMLGIKTGVEQLLLAVAQQASEEAYVEACKEVRKEMDELRQRLAAVEEREAAVCPEDVSFDEYIRSLKRQLEAARKGSPLHVNEANVLRAPDVED